MNRAGRLRGRAWARRAKSARLRERCPWLFDGRYVVYEARFPDGAVYIGRTGQSLSARIRQHKEDAAKGKRSAMCQAIREGEPSWHILWEGKNYFECQGREIALITERKKAGAVVLNHTRGGYYDRTDYERMRKR